MDMKTIQLLASGLLETVYMTLVSTALGYLIGLPVGILLTVTDKDGIHPNALVYRILDVIINIMRSIPFLILMTALSLPEGSVKKNRIGWGIGIVFLAASAVFFILLLPYATGMAAPAEWLNIGRKILRIWY